jgi:DUF3016 family protein
MKNVFIVICTLLVSFSSVAYAATSSVEWKDVEKYRDLRTVSGSNKSFKDKFFKEIEEHLAQLAQPLPESQTINFVITNVDLAGNIQLVGTREVRIVKEIFMPKISLSYELKDEQGQVIKSDTLDVKDPSFLKRTNTRVERETFGHEKAMLTRWFNQTFTE